MKKLSALVMALVVAVAFTGCARDSGSIFYRGWKHFQWHVLGFYKDLVELHKEVDRYVFNLDERNPDRY
jgi:hypothetical protein